MRYAPEKFEVIPVHGGGFYKSPDPRDLYQKAQIITESNETVIDGFWIQSNLKASNVIRTLRFATNQLSRIIQRVIRMLKGMREENTFRLV